MKYNITSKNLELTSAIESLLEKKLAKLDRFFTAKAAADVHLGMDKDQFRVEITVPVKGSVIRCEQEGKDLYALMDDAVDAMERQLKKYHGKLKDFYQSGGDFAPAYVEQEEDEEQAINIVRTKRFAVKPMDAEEACLQMELLGHSFYMFLNSETSEVNVVYKRKDGAYGLIEPIPDED